MYKLEFTLKQHTPIIHFQHNQDGATLRASEVKPKLDRFLINDIPKYWKEINEKFLKELADIKEAVENKKPSLFSCTILLRNQTDNKWYYFENTKPSRNNYDKEVANIKRRIKESFDIENVEIIFNTPFFANRDKVKDNKWDEIRLGILNSGKIDITFKSSNLKIIELLKISVPIFFTLENFGNRQNKGFGSFYLKDVKSDEISKILKRKYKVIKHISVLRNDVKNIFDLINKTYKNLKNNPLKSDSVKIRNYYLNHNEKENFEWEKKLAADFAKGEEVDFDDKTRYVRGILGLANLYDYPMLDKQIKISDSEQEIERFKSPLFFKVIDNNIFLVCNEVPNDMLNRTFIFEDDDFEIEILTPNYFNTNEFLKLLNEWNTL